MPGRWYATPRSGAQRIWAESRMAGNGGWQCPDLAMAGGPEEVRVAPARLAHMWNYFREPTPAPAPRRLAQVRLGEPADAGLRNAIMGVAAATVRGLERPGLVGRLAGFIDHAVAHGLLGGEGDLDTFIGRHNLQKHAYIAQELGIRIGYEFEFLKNGAYSPAMAVDTYKRDRAPRYAEALDPDPGATRTLVRIARGRGTEWLQVATFAVRDRAVSGALERFLADRHRHMRYDRRLVREVFAEVGSCMGAGGGGAR